MNDRSGNARRLVVVWRVTTRCNLSCGFCAYDRRVERARRSADARHAVELGRLLTRERGAKSRAVLVSFLGGEPFSWAPLAPVTSLLRYEFGFDLGVTTNGTALSSPAVQKQVLDRYQELTISVDGIGAVHDALRGWPGGFRTLSASIAAIAREKKERGGGPLLRANVVLFRETVDDFAPLCEMLAEWGIEEVTFNPLGGADRPEFYAEHGVLPEQADEFSERLPEMKRRLGAIGLRLKGDTAYVARMAASARGERLRVRDCRPGEDFLFVSEDGRISPCSFTSDGYGLPLTRARRLPLMFAAARERRPLAACDDCKSTQVFGKYAEP